MSTGAVLALASQGFAQTAPSAPVQLAENSASGGLEEVVVTAERSATNLQKTPIAVSAFSGETLTARGATSLRDIADMTPNLTVVNRDGLGAIEGGFTIRGIGVSAGASSPGVGIYVDDVYYPSRFGSILGLFDTERVEVLRGPQGTLFGRNTIGGAIQYITPEPDDEFGGYITGTAGSYNLTGLQAAVNLPINDDLAARIALGASDVSGFVHDDTTGQERGAENTRQGRVRIRWTPTSRLSVDLNLQALHFDSNGRSGIVTGVNTAIGPGGPSLANLAYLFGVPPLTTAYISSKHYNSAGYNSPDYSNNSFAQGSAAITYDITDDIKFKSISAYSSTRTRQLLDFDNTPLSIIAYSNGLDYTKLFTQEFQLQGKSFGDHLTWTIGAYYYDETEDNTGAAQTIAILNFPSGSIEYRDKATALYGQATYSFDPKWSITAGVRESNERSNGQVVLPSLPKQSARFSDTSPTFGINYQADDDLLFYAKASKGFRAGGIVVSPLLPPPFAKPYTPETAWTYEGGVRSTMLDNHLRLNLTGFYTDWKSIQFNYVDFSGAGPVPTVLNAGNADVYGFELETQYAVTNDLDLWGQISTLHGKYTDIDPTAASLVTLNTPLGRAPELKFAIGAVYTFHLSDGASISPNINYSWTDRQRSETSIEDNINMPSYGLLNARIGFLSADGLWGVDVYGTNLTNAYYYTGGINLSTASGTTFAELGRPHEYGLTLRRNF